MNAVTVPEASELALRYYRSGNVIWAIELVLGFVLPALLLFTGWSARLRAFASSLGRGHFYPTLVVYMALLALLLFVVQLPLTVYVGYVREHAYGLSTQRLSKFASARSPRAITHANVRTRAPEIPTEPLIKTRMIPE